MKKILLLLAKGFETYEASVFIDVMGWNLLDGDKTTKIVTCGINREVVSTFGLVVHTDITLEEVNVDDYEALAIPGGFEEYGFYEDSYSEEFLNLIREFYNKDKIIASICVAALPLGKSGVLTNKRATTYNLNNGNRQKQLKEFGVDVINEPVVVDGKIMTCWNPSTAIDVAFKLLEFLTSKSNTDYIKEIMGFKNNESNQ
ncbi:DJ-1/PfpI family protein [Clostridium intestinale]|uniref:DJ-1/PfpI family protein n=1 Tax=Clostridium intestinale URNW TaxID=1294142 RepID=U2N8E4_9CLOT|nr:DJ-1/PfpI family protein [Clostridium intestinale]ERK31792.1 DJ-1/PfpI family protein [Clostridium intestinale URNW]